MNDRIGIWGIVGCVLGSMLAIVGCFTNWSSVELLGSTETLTGIEANGGKVILVLAIISLAALGFMAFAKRLHRTAGILSAVMGLLIALIAWANIQDAQSELGSALGITVGVGLYLGTVGGLILIVGGALLIIRARHLRAESPSE